MSEYNQKKSDQLGIPLGTANGRLRKSIIFNLVQKLNLDVCYQCNKKIETEEEFSIEHKEPWLDSNDPKKLFFDLNNISFSHLSCNVRASRKMPKQPIKHGEANAYKNGCRCDLCTHAQKINQRKYTHR